MSLLRKSVSGMMLYAILLGIKFAKAQTPLSTTEQKVCFSVAASVRPSVDCDNVNQLNETYQGLLEKLELLSEKVQTFIPFLQVEYYVTNCAVGFKDGRVQNSDITASSIHGSNYEAHQGRLDYVRPSGLYKSHSWSAVTNRVGEWIQVDLKRPTHVTGVITQGRGDGDQWVTSFKISYSNNGNSFQTIRNQAGNDIVFQGNSDRNTYVMNRFPRPITARYFRLVAQSWHGHISIRMEYITC